MSGLTCPCCGKYFDEMPLDIAFRRPDAFLRLSDAEQTERAYANDDDCMIDGQHFFIRGYLPIPIVETDLDFAWGFWCKVSECDLKAYAAYSNGRHAAIEPFAGLIASSAAAYDGLEGLQVEVTPTSADQRPVLSVLPCDHPLYKDQQRGITLERVHAINATMFPGRF